MKIESFADDTRKEIEKLITDAIEKQFNQIVSVDGAADILGLSISKINEMVLSGKLNAYESLTNKPVFKKGELLTSKYNLPLWGQRPIVNPDKFKN